MADKVYVRPVIALLIAFMIGIAAGMRAPGLTVGGFFLASAAAALLAVFLARERPARILPLLLFLTLGYLSIQVWAAPDFPAGHVMHAMGSAPRRITGIVDGQPDVYPNRIRFVLEVETLGAESADPARGRILVSVWGKGLTVADGDRVAFVGTLREFRNFNNPGGFDYRRYMHFNNVWGASHVQGPALEILGRKPAATYGFNIQGARARIAELIDRTGEGEHRGVLKALIIGERSGISKETLAAFNRAGVSHLLAISGLHVGIVAAVSFAFFQWLLQWVRPLLWCAWTRKGAALLTLIPVFIYGLLAGMSPSTQRAVIMAAVFLLTFLLETDQDLMNTLAVAALVILSIFPPALFSISFQLSFSAVVFIVWGLSDAGKSPWLPGLPHKLLAFALVSFLALMGTLPLVMFHFNQVSLAGLASNIVLIPLIGFGVVPLSLAAVFILPLSPAGALWCLKAAAAVLNPSLEVVAFFASLPFAAVKTITPSLVEIVCYYGLAGIYFYGRQRRLHERAGTGAGAPLSAVLPEAAGAAAGRGGGRVKRLLEFLRPKQPLTAAAAGILLLAAGVDAGYWLHQRFRNSDLRITVLDVGQGSAALLEFPGGFRALIDGGGFSDNAGFDVGAQIVAPLLWRRKIRTVDLLVLSHPNSDHINGLLYIAEHFHVKEVWTNGQPAAIRGYGELLEIVRRNHIRMPAFDTLVRSREVNGVRLEILYPLAEYLEKVAAEKWRDLNNNSLVARIAFGSRSMLFPGDIMAPAEAELVSSAGAALAADVLISPHHGSAKSNSEEFLDAVSPQAVVVSAGWKNRFKFPHDAVLEKYRRRGLRIFRTDMDGAVSITTDGTNLDIRSFLTGAMLDNRADWWK